MMRCPNCRTVLVLNLEVADGRATENREAWADATDAAMRREAQPYDQEDPDYGRGPGGLV